MLTASRSVGEGRKKSCQISRTMNDAPLLTVELKVDMKAANKPAITKPRMPDRHEVTQEWRASRVRDRPRQQRPSARTERSPWPCPTARPERRLQLAHHFRRFTRIRAARKR